MPIKRQTYRLDQIDDWQGPVQQSGPTRDAAAQRVRPSGPVRDPRSEQERRAALLAEQDRFARQRPLERLLGSLPTDAQPPSTLWDRLNAPTVSLPRATTRSLDDAGSDLVRNAGTLGATLRGIRDIWGQAVNTAAGVVEGASSPMSLAMMAASGGASLAGKAGLFGISQGARLLEAGLSAPYVGHGLATIAQANTPADVILGGLETGLGAFGVRQAAKHAFPIPRVAAAYMQERGLPLEMPRLIKKTDERFAMRVADAYEAMQDAPNDPAVARAYAKMAEEASDQFRFIVSRAGVKTEAWRKPKQPYANSAEMLADIEQNNHLWYFPSESGFGQTDTVLATNPLLQPGKSGLPVNDEFRVVHDYFGHGRSRAQFGPVGEENATRTHETMFTPEARDAMITETRGQNSWVNFGPQMRRPDGTLIRKGEPGWLDPTKRAYADQRTGLMGAVARTPTTALAIAGPAAAQGVPDDPASDWDNVLRASLYGTTVAAATAGGLKRVNTGRTLINGLYSRLDEAASMIPTKGVPATGVLNWLKKAPEGISLEEVAYRKLPEWLESQGTKTVTPEMLAAHLRENPAPFPQVKTLGGPQRLTELPAGYRVEPLPQSYGDDRYTLVTPSGHNWNFSAENAADAQNEALRMMNSSGVPPTPNTKFSQYQVDGG